MNNLRFSEGPVPLSPSGIFQNIILMLHEHSMYFERLNLVSWLLSSITCDLVNIFMKLSWQIYSSTIHVFTLFGTSNIHKHILYCSHKRIKLIACIGYSLSLSQTPV